MVTVFNLFFPYPTYATACSDKTILIDNTPKTFLENSDPPDPKTAFTINFDVPSLSIRQLLNGKDIKLYYKPDFVGEWRSEPFVNFNQNQKSFSINIVKTKENGSLFTQGDKEGWLTYSDTGKTNTKDDKELCNAVKFHVGTKDSSVCEINPPIPASIKPNALFDIQFIGRPKIGYSIFIDGAAPPVGGTRSAITDNNGIGVFKDITFLGSDGQEKKISISSSRNGFCVSTTKLSQNAPIVVPGPLPPVNAPQNAQFPAGKQCEYDFPLGKLLNIKSDPNNPGLHTAIGCIPIKPDHLIMAILYLSTFIGGGIAFLIMLFGAFQLITSAGNPDTVKAGHDKIINAVIGLLFIIFSVLLLQIIGQSILKIPGFVP